MLLYVLGTAAGCVGYSIVLIVHVVKTFVMLLANEFWLNKTRPVD